ncbi:MAG TPA: FHA domain-containing protein [Gemmataceae bacterium]|nr:FHA domain-containing protein [Gemmataceae bacterium]
MQVRLVVDKGSKRSREFRLRGEETIVGRLKGCGLRIPSAEVSRRHCLLSCKDGYVTVEDLKSANGTYLNGEPVRGREVVRPGDQLQIGPVTFVVEYEMTQATIDRLARLFPPPAEDFEEVIDLAPLAEGAEEDVEVVEEVEEVAEEAGVQEPLDAPEVVADADDEFELPVAVEEGGAEEDFGVPLDAEDEDRGAVDFDAAGADQWQLPESEQLRDILSGLDEPAPAPPKPKKPQR